MRLLVCLLGILLSFPVSAKVYKEVKTQASDLQWIENPKVELAVEVELIRRAKNEIRYLTFDLRPDWIGKAVVQELFEAAKRGVRVQYVTSWHSQFFYEPLGSEIDDIFQMVGDLPIYYYTFGGPIQSPLNGWSVQDGVHSKLLIVDESWVLQTGRGRAEDYLQWLDTAFLMRGEVVQHASRAYDKLWKGIHWADGEPLPEMVKPEKAASVPTPGPDFYPEVFYDLSLSEQQDFWKLKGWMDDTGANPPEGASTIGITFFHHDFFREMKKLSQKCTLGLWGCTTSLRLEEVEDPILEEAIRWIQDPNRKEFWFYTLSPIMHPRFKMALQKRKQADASFEIKVFTNGYEAHKTVTRFPLAWYAGVSDLQDLLEMGAEVYALDSKLPGCPPYLHRKMFISGEELMTGSHNLTFSSSVRLDEMAIRVHGTENVQRGKDLFMKDAQRCGERINVDPKKWRQDTGIFQRLIQGISNRFGGFV